MGHLDQRQLLSLLLVYFQLCLEAPWHRVRAGHVRSAGSTSSHSRWRWVIPSFPFSSRMAIFLQYWQPAHSLQLPPSFLSSEAIAFSCFSELMKRMNQNFPHGGAMDTHFANMRSLIQVKVCSCQVAVNLFTNPRSPPPQPFLCVDPGFWTVWADAPEWRLHPLLLLLPLVSPGL